MRIAAALQRPEREAEIDWARRRDPAQLNAWGLTMLALPRVLKAEAMASGMALEWLDKAMTMAPHDALPLSLAAWCHGLRGCHNFSPWPEQEKAAASALARRAAELGPEDALSETFLAAGYTLAHDLPTAALHADRALALDGGSAWAWGRSGWIKAYEGNAKEAIERFQIARAFAPVDPLNFLWSVGIAAGHFAAADYARSARWFERALAENPAAAWINHALAPAYAFTGCIDRALRSLTGLLGSFPELTIAKVRNGLPYPSDFLDRVAEGLETAGMRPQ